MKANEIIKTIIKVITPITGGKFIGKFAVKTRERL